MNKITVDEFFKSNKRLAIHPGSIENDKALREAFDKKGHTWYSGRRYTEHNNYDIYKDETCYGNNRMSCDFDYYKSHGYKIIEFKDIDLK